MTITEQSRHDMVEAFTRHVGKDAAMTLAAHLPPVGWADVATKADLASLGDRLDRRIDLMAADIDKRLGISAVETEQMSERLDQRIDVVAAALEQLGQRLDQRIDLLAAEFRTDMAKLETRLTDKLTAQQRILYLSIVTTVLTIIGMSYLRP